MSETKEAAGAELWGLSETSSKAVMTKLHLSHLILSDS